MTGSDYDRAVGYSPLECVDQVKLRQLIRINKRIIDEQYAPQPEDVILVAGAGSGQEAIAISLEYKLKTVGVDLNIHPSVGSPGGGDLSFQKQDLMALAFRDNVFSLVYCYHVLEHVTDPGVVLGEIQRVLKPGGVLFIGFPNKHRLASYMGTAQSASIVEKIMWNLNDYKYRAQGRFENRYGAHAGFTQGEFVEQAARLFPLVSAVRNRYMLLKYSRYQSLIRSLISTKLAEFAFPSNYFVCIKGGQLE